MIVGLTGGIATGKSESVKYLQELGAYCIDADLISKELTKKGLPAFNDLVKKFGENILLLDGSLDRKKLGDIIFSNKQAKLKVEKILHAYIISCINEIVLAEKYNHSLIIINAPLLFEVGLDRICDKIVVVWAPYKIEASRLAIRDTLNMREVKRRIQSQMPIEKKMELADFVIDNSRTKQKLKNNIISLYKLLTYNLK
ncbi:MAG: dephospho-CoA kinase [Endomicrobium sp.]|jgi:dephospho-CoA kinase|nr:dephospho-CoA kinase [Endomicrobium sp.]